MHSYRGPPAYEYSNKLPSTGNNLMSIVNNYHQEVTTFVYRNELPSRGNNL